ncbi:MAG: transposase [Betaproteobacteria bacterium]|nr:transposase [Betaproteobacteria bacterium]
MCTQFEETQTKQRTIGEFRYAAESWNIERRIVTRLECGSQGTNPRFVVTNLTHDAVTVYDQIYCQRGEAGNRIKETQLDLFGTRASSHKFAANWLRLMLAALACTLMQRFRTLALAGTELARAPAATIQVKLLKIGGAIVRNTRRIKILLASHHPMRETFLAAARALAP